MIPPAQNAENGRYHARVGRVPVAEVEPLENLESSLAAHGADGFHDEAVIGGSHLNEASVENVQRRIG